MAVIRPSTLVASSPEEAETYGQLNQPDLKYPNIPKWARAARVTTRDYMH